MSLTAILAIPCMLAESEIGFFMFFSGCLVAEKLSEGLIPQR